MVSLSDWFFWCRIRCWIRTDRSEYESRIIMVSKIKCNVKFTKWWWWWCLRGDEYGWIDDDGDTGDESEVLGCFFVMFRSNNRNSPHHWRQNTLDAQENIAMWDDGTSLMTGQNCLPYRYKITHKHSQRIRPIWCEWDKECFDGGQQLIGPERDDTGWRIWNEDTSDWSR